MRPAELKSDQCGIETAEVIEKLQKALGSNRTNVGLKRFSVAAPHSIANGSNRTNVGLKPEQRQLSSCAGTKLKSDQCGIETSATSYCPHPLFCPQLKSDQCGIETRSNKRYAVLRGGSNRTNVGLKRYNWYDFRINL